MTRFFALLRSRIPLRPVARSEGGAASIEYALLAAIVGLGLISALNNLKYGLNTNYDRISLAIQRVNNDTSGTRKETSRDGQFSYTSNGTRIDQVYIHYDDGSTVLLRTSPDPNSWFKSIYYDFGKDNVNHGAYVTRNDGSTYSETYDYVRDGVVNVNYTEGTSQHSYLQQQIDLGGGYYGYRQTMNSSNIAGDWVSGYAVNYYGNDSSGQYVENSIGSTYTYANGAVYNYGSDISKYKR